MTRPSVVVLDYGSGNVHSAAKALELAGADVELTADRARALAADGLVVPGVGAFSAVMAGVERVDGAAIVEQRLIANRPVLGVCVGMQVLFENGVERGVETEGLGEWPGTVTLLEAPIVPHMGWNTVDAPEDSVLFDGICRRAVLLRALVRRAGLGAGCPAAVPRAGADLGRSTAPGSSPRSRTDRSPRRSSTPRSRAKPASTCFATGSPRSECNPPSSGE